jgi:hypothetical protein
MFVPAKRSHKNSTFIKHKQISNMNIRLNTRFMFKIGIFVFKFNKI